MAVGFTDGNEKEIFSDVNIPILAKLLTRGYFILAQRQLECSRVTPKMC